MGGEMIIDRWIEKLGNDNPISAEEKEKLVAELQTDYRDEIRLKRMLTAEAEHLPYPHLTEAALKLAEDKQKVADTIRDLIMGLDGSVELEPGDNLSVEATGDFTEILKLENEIGERLVEHANLAEDNGLTEMAQTLLKLKDEHYTHQERIEALIMKTNGTL